MDKCIPKEIVDELKKIDFKNLSTIERENAFKNIVGDDRVAKDINMLYEKSRTLINQDRAFNKFIDNINGVNAEKKLKIKERFREIKKIKKDTIQNEDLLSLVQDTYNKKYDLDIPLDVVEKINNINKEIDRLDTLRKGTPDGSPEKFAYGLKVGELSDIINSQINPNEGLKGYGKDILKRISNQETTGGKVRQSIIEGVDVLSSPVLKSLKASWDNSVLFRQGLKVLTASRSTWTKGAKNTYKVWSNIANRAELEKTAQAFRADMVSKDLYKDALDSGLAIGVAEDFFPTNIAENIPGLGNLFKASDDAFTMFTQGSRMDLFEKYVNTFKQMNDGAMPSKEILKDFATLANELTGRSSLGKAEAISGLLNKIFFSARFQKANLATFYRPIFDNKLSAEARTIARKNLAVHTAFVAGLLQTAALFTDVGFDPKESTFGKMRIPGTDKWIDLTGGLASYLTLVGRQYKAFTTKTKYREDTPFDIFINFLAGKLAPTPAALRDIFEKRNFQGEKPTVGSVAKSLFVPLTADNIYENYQEGDDASIIALQALLESVGAGISSPKSKREGSYSSPLDLIINR